MSHCLYCLLGPCSIPFSAPNPEFSVCLTSHSEVHAHKPGFGHIGTYSGLLEFSRAWRWLRVEVCLLLFALALSVFQQTFNQGSCFNLTSPQEHGPTNLLVFWLPCNTNEVALSTSEWGTTLNSGLNFLPSANLLMIFPFVFQFQFSGLLSLFPLSWVFKSFQQDFYHYFNELSRDGRG